MKLIIHDLPKEEFHKLMPDPDKDTLVIGEDPGIHPCIGCFGCWLKTPGTCMIRSDAYGDMGYLISQSEKITIISKCCYGGFSSFVKNVLDRSLPYLHPDFVIKNGEMHHKQRYKKEFELTVHFYGEAITEEEKEIAKELVKANSINFYCKVRKVSFFRSPDQIKGGTEV
ncbi:flavodoxin family protein [uncultured Robinsoniella sp.]|uniref:flavodoxin family protein n=1 Tax=uncultured Robinsoniella sp. TaxID=904190 RepID=UPI00374EE9D5